MTATQQPQSSTQSRPVTNVSSLSVGDTVSFHYALSNIDGKLYSGRVLAPVKHSELWGDVVLVEPFVSDYHLPPRHVSLSRIVAIVADAPVMIDETPAPTYTREDVKRLEDAWWAAQDEPKTLDEAVREPHASRIHNARTAYLIASATFRNDPSQMPCQEDIEALKASQVTPAPVTLTKHVNADGLIEVDDPADAPVYDEDDLWFLPTPSRKPTPAPVSPAEAVSVSAAPAVSPVEARQTGVVSYCDRLNGYGYIKSDGESYYFRDENKMHRAMDIMRGDTVTFVAHLAMGESAGMPKALNILVDGYTPAVKPAYTAPQERVTEARDAAQHTAKARNSLKTQAKAQTVANAASIARVFGKAE